METRPPLVAQRTTEGLLREQHHDALSRLGRARSSRRARAPGSEKRRAGRQQPAITGSHGAKKKTAGPREADRPLDGEGSRDSAYCMLNWAFVPGVVPQSYSCIMAPFAVLGPWMFRQRPEATFWKAYTPEVDIGSAV